jgi:hypothetical protein
MIVAFESTLYRLKVVKGFLEEIRQDVQLLRWRSAVDNAQLVVENSAVGYENLLSVEDIHDRPYQDNKK